MAKLQVKKKIEHPNEEKVFYNTTFKNNLSETIQINLTCEKNKKFTYGEILAEHEKRQNGQAHNSQIANVCTQIIHKDFENRSENVLYQSSAQKHRKCS